MNNLTQFSSLQPSLAHTHKLRLSLLTSLIHSSSETQSSCSFNLYLTEFLQKSLWPVKKFWEFISETVFYSPSEKTSSKLKLHLLLGEMVTELLKSWQQWVIFNGLYVSVSTLFTVLCCYCFVVAHGLSSCGIQVPKHSSSVVAVHGLSCSMACRILLPWPGIKPTFPAL